MKYWHKVFAQLQTGVGLYLQKHTWKFILFFLISQFFSSLWNLVAFLLLHSVYFSSLTMRPNPTLVDGAVMYFYVFLHLIFSYYRTFWGSDPKYLGGWSGDVLLQPDKLFIPTVEHVTVVLARVKMLKALRCYHQVLKFFNNVWSYLQQLGNYLSLRGVVFLPHSSVCLLWIAYCLPCYEHCISCTSDFCVSDRFCQCQGIVTYQSTSARSCRSDW